MKHFQTLGLVVLWTISLIFRKFNYTEDNTCLNLCLCISGVGGSEVGMGGTPPSASGTQTPDRAPSRMAVRMLVPCERSKSSVALRSNHRGIYSPHDEGGERIKRTGWREERGKRQTRAVQKWKPGRRRKKGGKLKGELLSMAERRKESRNEKWETDGGKKGTGEDRDEDEEAKESTIRVKMNRELRTLGPEASKKLRRWLQTIWSGLSWCSSCVPGTQRADLRERVRTGEVAKRP